MAPTIVRDGPFRLFFFLREEARKFWLTPDVLVATPTGLSQRQLCGVTRIIVEAHIEEIRNAWQRHFFGA